MGFDIVRFVGEVDEELLCPICTGVLQDPVQVKFIHLLFLTIHINNTKHFMSFLHIVVEFAFWYIIVQWFNNYLLFQAPACEHAFCKGCILEWLLRQSTCPVDRLSVNVLQLRPVPRILKNLLNRFVNTVPQISLTYIE